MRSLATYTTHTVFPPTLSSVCSRNWVSPSSAHADRRAPGELDHRLIVAVAVTERTHPPRTARPDIGNDAAVMRLIR